MHLRFRRHHGNNYSVIMRMRIADAAVSYVTSSYEGCRFNSSSFLELACCCLWVFSPTPQSKHMQGDKLHNSQLAAGQVEVMFQQQFSFLLFEFWFCSQMTTMTFNNSARISPRHLLTSGIYTAYSYQTGRMSSALILRVVLAIILNVTTFTTDRFFFFFRIDAKAEKELRKKFKVDFFFTFF